MSDVIEQRSPQADGAERIDERRAGTTVLFVRASSGRLEVPPSVSSVGAPTDLQQIATSILNEFGEALDRLAE